MAMARATPTLPTAMEPHSENVKNEKSDDEVIIPGLPNDLSILCLCLVQPSLLYAVCRSWRRLIYSPSFPPFFSLYALFSPLSSSPNHDTNQIEFFSLDPFSTAWRRLPTPSQNPPLRFIHRHPSFISRNLPIQSATVSGHLVLLAGTTHRFLPALSQPLVFHPDSNRWFSGPSFSVPRRWCAAGSVGNAVYIASGVGSRYDKEVAQSVEKWEMKKKSSDWRWEKMAGLVDGRFSREAVEAVGYRGKLHMVNVKGNAVKQDAIYNVEKDAWEKMPIGMIAGWNGPAAAMDEEEMFVVDENKGILSKYDHEKDRWEKVVESWPLKGVEQISAGRGRVCAVCGNGVRVVVVDVTAKPAKLWVVERPEGMRVVAIHILPRMTLPTAVHLPTLQSSSFHESYPP